MPQGFYLSPRRNVRPIEGPACLAFRTAPGRARDARY
jgi:hypothetical protein